MSDPQSKEKKVTDRGPLLRYGQPMWALTNMGRVFSVHATRQQAKDACVLHCGHTWAIAKEYMEIRKVNLVEITNDRS